MWRWAHAPGAAGPPPTRRNAPSSLPAVLTRSAVLLPLPLPLSPHNIDETYTPARFGPAAKPVPAPLPTNGSEAGLVAPVRTSHRLLVALGSQYQFCCMCLFIF